MQIYDKYIGLMAAEGNHGFYEKLGYFARPAEGFGPGMMKFCEIPAGLSAPALFSRPDNQ